MKCRYCKAEIPEGELYCKKCGREVQIVPDYNPLEEMLTAQIQLDGNEQESELDQYINQKRRNNNRTGTFQPSLCDSEDYLITLTYLCQGLFLFF